MASTDARPFPLKNTAFRVVFPILDADGDIVTGATGLDSEISKDQGTFADCTNEATEIATSSGIYYLDLTNTEMNADHVAIIAGDPANDPAGAVVRVHSECLTGEAFGSLKCECGPQLDTALSEIQERGGVVIYLRGHEGRGIGLINKLRAYRLQEGGLDTLDANVALGLPIDARDYTAASAILADLGIERVRLLTNNPEKVHQLEAHGIRIADRLPLVVGVGAVNAGYLETKRTRMGHAIDDRQLTEAAADELLKGHAS